MCVHALNHLPPLSPSPSFLSLSPPIQSNGRLLLLFHCLQHISHNSSLWSLPILLGHQTSSLSFPTSSQIYLNQVHYISLFLARSVEVYITNNQHCLSLPPYCPLHVNWTRLWCHCISLGLVYSRDSCLFLIEATIIGQPKYIHVNSGYYWDTILCNLFAISCNLHAISCNLLAISCNLLRISSYYSLLVSYSQ